MRSGTLGVKFLLDPVNADRLWEVSEQLLGQRFAWT